MVLPVLICLFPVPMELPFSRLLKTCAKDLMDDTLWNAMGDFQHNGEEVKVSVKPVMDLHLLRFKSQSNSSDVLEDGFDVTSVPRPEVIYNDQILRKHGLRDPACAYHLEQLLAPGDVIIQRSYRQAFRQRWGKTVSKAAVLTGTAQPLETKSMEVVSRTRLLTWRDYPSSGQSTFAGVPFDPLTESFVTQVGSEMAWLVVMSPGSPGLINVNVGLFVSASFPSWAASLMTKMVHAMHELFQARMKEMKSIGCSEALLKEDRSLYIILSLRTCPHGRPLLPLLRSSSGTSPEGVVSVTGVGAAQNLTTWFRPTGTFSLPSYLSDLLAILGCDDVQVFDSLEGRQLVPYQAVLRREQWERIGSLFNDVWLTHRAAYKKLNSCKHAPTIVDGRQPREADKPFLPAGGAAPEPVSPSYSIAVRNTFIEIGEEIPSTESPFSRACSR